MVVSRKGRVGRDEEKRSGKLTQQGMSSRVHVEIPTTRLDLAAAN